MARGYQWPDPWLSLNPNFASRRVDHRAGRRGTAPARSARGSSGSRTATPAAPAAPPAPASARGHRGGAHRQQLRADHRHRLRARAWPTSSRSWTGSCAPRPAGDLPAGDQGDRRLPDERPGQQPARGAGEVPADGLPRRTRAGHVRALHRAGVRRTTGTGSSRTRPDILLTNYVMLELVLTRPRRPRALIEAAQGLRFLVLDELHTYRGRQGADVALLVRRLKDACDARGRAVHRHLRHDDHRGDASDQRQAVADVASTAVRRPRPARSMSSARPWSGSPTRRPSPARCTAGADRRPGRRRTDFADFTADPLATWIEEVFGFEPRPPPASPRRRRRPPTLPEAAAAAGRADRRGRGAVRESDQGRAAGRRRGSAIPATGRPRVRVPAAPVPVQGRQRVRDPGAPGTRHVTSTYQVARQAPSSRADSGQSGSWCRLAFCRECGQDYLVGDPAATPDGGRRYAAPPRQRRQRRRRRPAATCSSATTSRGRATLEQALAEGRLPYSWLTYDPDGRPGRRSGPAEATCRSPCRWSVTGREAAPGERHLRRLRARARSGSACAAAPPTSRPAAATSPSWPSSSAGGPQLGHDADHRHASCAPCGPPRKEISTTGARKLLAFVDNRQDAALQAGHFNDFVQVTQLRGALYRALDEGSAGGPDRRDRRPAGHRGARPDHGRLRAQPGREVRPARTRRGGRCAR